jgi:hypothetical protein
VVVEVKKKSFKEMFPNLSEEFEGGKSKVTIDSVRNTNKAEKPPSDKFCNYNPTVVDFIRRCDTEVQAEEIIMYLEKKGELTEEYAEDIRKRLRKEGVRCFGPKKQEDYYLKHGGF